MIRNYTVAVTYGDGSTERFVDVLSWSVNDHRLIIALKPSKDEVVKKNVRKAIRFRSKEITFMLRNLKYFESFVEKTIDDPEEMRKHDAFLARGIDMMVTEISHTVPPDPEEVKKQIAKEQKGFREEKKIKI